MFDDDDSDLTESDYDDDIAPVKDEHQPSATVTTATSLARQPQPAPRSSVAGLVPSGGVGPRPSSAGVPQPTSTSGLPSSKAQLEEDSDSDWDDSVRLVFFVMILRCLATIMRNARVFCSCTMASWRFSSSPLSLSLSLSLCLSRSISLSLSLSLSLSSNAELKFSIFPRSLRSVWL